MKIQSGTNPLFAPRERPYDPIQDYRKILNAHSRRDVRLHEMLQKIDRLHPQAYGMTLVQPELGHRRANFTQKLAGFEDTAAYSQFLSEIDAYANRDLMDTLERRDDSTSSTVEVLESHRNGKTTRDSLRAFLTILAQHPQYTQTWKSSSLNLKTIKDEIKKLSSKQDCVIPALEMWNMTMRANSNRFKSVADQKLIIRLLDAIARERMEPLLPSHPMEGRLVPVLLCVLIFRIPMKLQLIHLMMMPYLWIS